MEADIHPEPIPSSGTVWRRLPWSVPRGRRPPFWASVPEGLWLATAWLAITSGQLIGNVGFSTSIAVLGVGIVGTDVAVTVLAAGYGLALIARAGGSHRRPRTALMAGLVATPAATRWFGLAFVIPAALSWGIAFTLHPTSTADQSLALVWLVAPASYAVLLVLARRTSNGGVKRAVLSGVAPTFVMSRDRGWWLKGDTWVRATESVWWNGQSWVHGSAEVPANALRSPDGNYWWTGSTWCAMPPLERRAQRGAPAAAL